MCLGGGLAGLRTDPKQFLRMLRISYLEILNMTLLQRVLVTGGGGYVGSILVPKLLESNYVVVSLDTFVFGKPNAGGSSSEPLQYLQTDIRDIQPEMLAGIDAVIHLAALSNDPSCELDTCLTEEVNEIATIRFARMCKAQGVKRFIFASSCSVYGASDGEPSTETSELRPISKYARCKVNVERELRELADDSFCTISLRKATLFGISPRMRFDLVANIMALHAIKTGKITAHGGGLQWRPLLHVSDAANAYVAALRCEDRSISGKAYNVVSQNTRVIDLANRIAELATGTEIVVEASSADARDYMVDGQLFENQFGFLPEFDVDRGLEELMEAIKGSHFDDSDNPIYYTVKMWKSFLERPAIQDGQPVRRQFLPFALPLLGKEEEDEVIDTLRSGWITTGPKTKRFEEMCAEYVGCKHAVALSSCTAALHLAVAALDIGPGDEVITTPVSWPATANVIIHQGAKPAFVDIEADTLNIDPQKIEQAITSRTKAIIPVHMAGQPCDMNAIQAIADKHRLAVIEDAAHAIGAEYLGRRVGSMSTATAFSFYPIKNMTTIEGGLLATDDDALADRARVLSLHGISKDAWKRYSNSGSLHWELQEPGFKYNMTDVQASLGLHQLQKLDGFIETRQRYASMYDAAFADLAAIRPLSRRDGMRHAHHLYVILLDLDRLTISRDEFIHAMKAENIGIGIHFVSMHLQPYYQRAYQMQPQSFPVATDASKRLLSLPLYPKMTESDVYSVISAIHKLCSAYRNNIWAAKSTFAEEKSDSVAAPGTNKVSIPS